MRILLIAFLLLATDLKSELESLIKAERAFSRLSINKGTREAFLANLSEESIIFRPTAVKGKQWFENNSVSPGQLSWQPEFADISRSGDLGYTTGPFKFERAGNGEPVVAVGHYVTIWKRQMDGLWKIQLDIGIAGDLLQHKRLPDSIPVTSPRVAGDVQKASPEAEIRAARAALTDAEGRFPTTSQNYATALAADARLYRDGRLPLTNLPDIRKALGESQGTFAWKLGDVGMSGSTDLGYAYGVVELKPAGASTAVKTYNYLHIWKRQSGNSWKVVLDLQSM